MRISVKDIVQLFASMHLIVHQFLNIYIIIHNSNSNKVPYNRVNTWSIKY